MTCFLLAFGLQVEEALRVWGRGNGGFGVSFGVGLKRDGMEKEILLPLVMESITRVFGKKNQNSVLKVFSKEVMQQRKESKGTM